MKSSQFSANFEEQAGGAGHAEGLITSVHMYVCMKHLSRAHRGQKNEENTLRIGIG